MTEFYNDIPIKGTRQQREVLRFRDSEKIVKKKNRKNRQIRLDKRRFLTYNNGSES